MVDMHGHRYDFRIGERVFMGGTHVMAIINLTPDSFYAPSRASGDEDIVARAKRYLLDGADVLDIGGQSTRPGAARVGVLEELARTLPAVRAIKSLSVVNGPRSRRSARIDPMTGRPTLLIAVSP